MSCIMSSDAGDGDDAPSVGASSAAAAFAIALVCWVAVFTCSATPLAGARPP
jgi:hypothetical protein